MRLKIALFAVIILVLVSTAWGFDGDRKGFVLGGGIGFAPVSKWSVDVDFFDINVVNYEESKAGLALHIVIGGAFDEYNMLVYEINATGHDSERLNAAVSQGFSGAVWYHYFGQTGHSFYTALGLGVQIFKIGEYDAANPEGALLVGAGYEFAPHWQAGAYLSGGKTSDSAAGLEGKFEHGQLSIIVSGLAF